MSTNDEPIVACPGYCCSDIAIRDGAGYLTLEKLAELAPDPDQLLARFYFFRMLIPVGKDVRGVDHFDCNFFDADTRRCTNYAERPTVCRKFPVEDGCTICTYDNRYPDVPGAARAVR
jgi:Fe-S-cluster containining protein